MIENFKQVWLQATNVHKFFLVSIAAGFLLVGFMLMNWASQTEFALLYGDLDSDNISKISKKLTDEGVNFKLGTGGNAILVPKDSVHQLRAKLAGQNLPEGSNEGWKILDRDSIGMSPFKENVNFMRAKCGELSQTIKAMPGVRLARVQIVMPQRSVLSKARQEAKASVFIKSDGSGLSKINVHAITHLVANSAKGVVPANVAVVVDGKLEAGAKKDDNYAFSNSLLEQQKNLENYLANKAENQLAMVVGPGKCAVTVNATLSTSSIKRTTKKIDAAGRIETKTMTRKKDQLTPGKSDKNANGSSKEKTEEIEYDTPYTLEQQVDGPGRVQEITASVLIDLSDVNKPKEGATATESLTEEKVRSIVQKALGLKTPEGIVVKNVPFKSPALEPDPAMAITASPVDLALKYSKHGSLVVAIIVMLVMFKKLTKKPATNESSSQASSAEGDPNAEGSEEAPTPAMQAKHLKGKDRALRQKIVNSLSQNPDQVKQMFLSWIESSAS